MAFVDKVVANDGNLLHLDVSSLHIALNRGTKAVSTRNMRKQRRRRDSLEIWAGMGLRTTNREDILLNPGYSRCIEEQGADSDAGKDASIDTATRQSLSVYHKQRRRKN